MSNHHASRFKLLAKEELGDFSQMNWIIKGVLPAEGLASIYGPSMSGKTFLAVDMANIVADGQEWFGKKVLHVPVTYVCLEGRAGLLKRLQAIEVRRDKKISDRVRFVTQSFNLLNENDVEELGTAIIAVQGRGGLIIIDTLNRATPNIDENSSSDMRKVISACEVLQEITNGLILLIHHTGKQDGRGPRGHSSLFSALDCGIETKNINNTYEWVLKKVKDDKSDLSHAFRLEVVNLGADSDGDDVTSCIVMPCENVKQEVERIGSKVKGANQKIALDVLNEAFDDSVTYGQDNIPGAAFGIEFNDAVELVRSVLACGKRYRKARATEAINGLVDYGFFSHSCGKLWRMQ